MACQTIWTKYSEQSLNLVFFVWTFFCIRPQSNQDGQQSANVLFSQDPKSFCEGCDIELKSVENGLRKETSWEFRHFFIFFFLAKAERFF